MKADWRGQIRKRIQRIFWIYFTCNFHVTKQRPAALTTPKKPCTLLRVSEENYQRVREFREEGRVNEYQAKLKSGEIGAFAECEGKIAGSIWATLNRENILTVARGYMELNPGEAMIHDIVASDKIRGMGIGPFMVGEFTRILLYDYHARQIIIDVNARNKASLRMMEKAGLAAQEKVLSISFLNDLLAKKVSKFN